MNWQDTKAFLAPCFPEEVRAELELLLPGELREIRVRADRPTVLVAADRAVSLSWSPGQHQVEALAEALAEHGLCARTEETRQGYVTLRGGHRMGLCGRVYSRNGVRQLAAVGSVCVRIAGEWPGTADRLMPSLKQGRQPQSALVIGPPGAGKTTLLRDAARQLGSGREACQVAVIDERGELAACVDGVPQLDVGLSTDVLDGCPKAQAVPWLIRSMAPQVIVTDELADETDAACVLDAIACGSAVLASVHGSSMQEVASRPAMAALMARRAFGAYAVLSPEGGGRVAALYDRTGSPVKPA